MVKLHSRHAGNTSECRAPLRDLRADTSDGRADSSFLAERRRRLRRRVSALPGARARVRLGEGGGADDVDDLARPASAALLAREAPRAAAAQLAAPRRERADAPPPLRSR